jgi:hypothetical protein
MGVGAWVCGVIPRHAQDFPNLPDPPDKTSNSTDSYNCIAWATGDNQRWWQPESFQQYYWPNDDDPDPFALQGLVLAYEQSGYVACADDSGEEGYEKIVLYADAQGQWTHAARRLPDGRWTSKLGDGIDLSHSTPDELTGPKYGTPVLFMKKAS